MSDSIATFFEAWQIEDAADRTAKIASAVTENVRYDDPRTPESLSGLDALCNYVGMFSANAPGWSARVVASDATNGMIRATVAFGGKGPDGSDQIQYGQYFVEMDGELVSRMVGFVGTGQTE